MIPNSNLVPLRLPNPQVSTTSATPSSSPLSNTTAVVTSASAPAPTPTTASASVSVSAFAPGPVSSSSSSSASRKRVREPNTANGEASLDDILPADMLSLNNTLMPPSSSPSAGTATGAGAGVGVGGGTNSGIGSGSGSGSVSAATASLQAGLMRAAMQRDAALLGRHHDLHMRSDYDLRDGDIDVEDVPEDEDVDDFIHVELHNQSAAAAAAAVAQQQSAALSLSRHSNRATAMFVPFYHFGGSDFDDEYVGLTHMLINIPTCVPRYTMNNS